MLFKNIAHDGSFKHFRFLIFVCICHCLCHLRASVDCGGDELSENISFDRSDIGSGLMLVVIFVADIV